MVLRIGPLIRVTIPLLPLVLHTAVVITHTSSSTPAPTPITPDGNTLDLAVGVMQGKYGDGDTRRNNLGTRYNEVQDFINHICKEHQIQKQNILIIAQKWKAVPGTVRGKM